MLCEGITSSHGDVVNISSGGVKLRRRGKALALGEEIDLELKGAEISATVRARVVWARQTGLFGRSCEVGLSFVDLSEAQARALTDVLREAMSFVSLSRA